VARYNDPIQKKKEKKKRKKRNGKKKEKEDTAYIMHLDLLLKR